MKTAQKLINEIANSTELQKELLTTKVEDYEAFLRDHDCEASVDEVKQLLSKEKPVIELTDDELDAVVGGGEGINKKFDKTICFCQNSGCPDQGTIILVEGEHVGETMTCPSCGQKTLLGKNYPAITAL